MSISMTIQILALGTATIRRAQDAISSCEACNKDAELPFDWILDEVTLSDSTTARYIWDAPAKCPRCCDVFEKTLIEPTD